MTKGIITYWITDIKKVKEKVENFRNIVDKINPVIKKSMLEDIDTITRIISKGKIK